MRRRGLSVHQRPDHFKGRFINRAAAARCTVMNRCWGPAKINGGNYQHYLSAALLPLSVTSRGPGPVIMLQLELMFKTNFASSLNNKLISHPVAFEICGSAAPSVFLGFRAAICMAEQHDKKLWFGNKRKIYILFLCVYKRLLLSTRRHANSTDSFFFLVFFNRGQIALPVAAQTSAVSFCLLAKIQKRFSERKTDDVHLAKTRKAIDNINLF